MGERLIVQH